jgi:two-component system chemotaxis sensor kinase CheA
METTNIDKFCIDREILEEFASETANNAEQIENDLSLLELGKGGREAVNSIFRRFHTIKGDAASLEIFGVSAVAHAAESVMERFRKTKTWPLADDSAVIYLACAALKKAARMIAIGKAAPDLTEYSILIDRLKERSAAVPDKAGLIVKDIASGDENSQEVKDVFINVRPEKIEDVIRFSGEMLVMAQEIYGRAHKTEVFSEKEKNNLMKKLGGMLKLAGTLHDTAFSMRMVGIRRILRRLDAVVNTVCKKTGKKAELKCELLSEEADRSIAEKIGEPLMHIIRNAVDHGIECPVERLKSGKSEYGVIKIKVYSAQDSLFVEVTDDGSGIDTVKIAEKAIKAGIIKDMSEMTDALAAEIITSPGFSTADGVSEVSGRGVGMDVVKKYVESMHGNLTIKSEKGKGTSVLMQLPENLSVMNLLILEIEGKKYMLPESNASAVLKPAFNGTLKKKGREFIFHNGEEISVLNLPQLWGGNANQVKPGEVFIIISEGGKKTAISADKVPRSAKFILNKFGCLDGSVSYFTGAAVNERGIPCPVINAGKVILAAEKLGRIYE